MEGEDQNEYYEEEDEYGEEGEEGEANDEDLNSKREEAIKQIIQ